MRLNTDFEVHLYEDDDEKERTHKATESERLALLSPRISTERLFVTGEITTFLILTL